MGPVRRSRPSAAARRERSRLMMPDCTSAAIAFVELQQAVHSRERDDDAALDRHGAAAEPGSRAARDDRFAAIAGDLHDRAHITRRIRKHHGRRHSAFRVGVERIDRQIFGSKLGLHRSPAPRASLSRSIVPLVVEQAASAQRIKLRDRGGPLRENRLAACSCKQCESYRCPNRDRVR